MKSKTSNTSTFKTKIDKCEDTPCVTHSEYQKRGTEFFASLEEIASFKTNVPFVAADGKEYTTDILGTTVSGQPVVAECVQFSLLRNIGTMKRLELSRDYWLNHGVTDWRIMAVEEK